MPLAPNSLAARRAKTAAAEAAITSDENDSIILSCRLKSGKFESSIEVPLYATQAEMNEFAAQWLQMMYLGVKIGQGRKSQ